MEKRLVILAMFFLAALSFADYSQAQQESAVDDSCEVDLWIADDLDEIIVSMGDNESIIARNGNVYNWLSSPAGVIQFKDVRGENFPEMNFENQPILVCAFFKNTNGNTEIYPMVFYFPGVDKSYRVIGGIMYFHGRVVFKGEAARLAMN